MHNIKVGRALRNLREALKYPWWLVQGKHPPDNHYYKVQRIKRLGRAYNCGTLIETGTFFGQTVAAAASHFTRVFSVELSQHLFERNRRSFKNYSNVQLFHGDSAQRLAGMIDRAEGRILYWLDGHYSNGVTAQGELITPILTELAILKDKNRQNDCILIDDVRLFTGTEGYPSIAVVSQLIRSISSDYIIKVDSDCLVATPPNIPIY